MSYTNLYERLSQYIESFDDSTPLSSIICSDKFWKVFYIGLFVDVPPGDPQVATWFTTLYNTFRLLQDTESIIDNTFRTLRELGFDGTVVPPDHIDLILPPCNWKKEVNNAEKDS